MKILVTAATKLEIEPFIKEHRDGDILITGVGIAATGYHLLKKLQQKDYDLVIQAGVAGCFNEKYELGEVVLVLQDAFGDIGTEEKGIFTSVFDINLADKNEPPFTNGWLVNTSSFIEKIQLKKAKAITVNKVSDSELQKKQQLTYFNADIESMEGAALHYTCLQEKIPFIQLRSISNYVGERDKLKWKMKEAISNLNTVLIKILKEIDISIKN